MNKIKELAKNKLEIEIINRNKGNWFVQHIQDHLDNGDTGLKCYKIPEGVVGCAICGKTVDEIAKDKLNKLREEYKKR